MYSQEIKYITSIKNIDENNLTDRLHHLRNTNQQNFHTQVSDRAISHTPNHDKTLERSK